MIYLLLSLKSLAIPLLTRNSCRSNFLWLHVEPFLWLWKITFLLWCKIMTFSNLLLFILFFFIQYLMENETNKKSVRFQFLNKAVEKCNLAQKLLLRGCSHCLHCDVKWNCRFWFLRCHEFAFYAIVNLKPSVWQAEHFNSS